MSEPPAKGLVLSFQHTDLSGLKEEGEDVIDAFDGINCPMEEFKMSANTAPNALKAKLDEFLAEGETPRVIYYHGHGGENSQGELMLSRYLKTPIDHSLVCCPETAS